MPLTVYVHPRLGLASFKRFEPLLHPALHEFKKGNETEFTLLDGLSPSTICARMRDALQGLRLNLETWRPSLPEDLINLFQELDGKFVISHDTHTNTVWLRHKHQTGRRHPNQFGNRPGQLNSVIPSVHQAAGSIRINPANLSPDDYTHIAVLVAAQAFDLPLVFSGDVTPYFLNSFDTLGVVANFNPEHNETVVT